MERLLSVSDICERYQVKAVTARRYMRDMEHMESPLMVTERAVTAWEHRKTLPPESVTREQMKKGGKRVGTLAVHETRRRTYTGQP